MVKIPTRLDELLPTGAVSKVFDLLQQQELSTTVREALQRVGFRDSQPIAQVQSAWRHAKDWIEGLARGDAQVSDVRLINATGRLFGSSWNSLPINVLPAQAYGALVADYIDHVCLDASSQKALRDLLNVKEGIWLNGLAGCWQSLATTEWTRAGVAIARTDLVRNKAGDLRAIIEACGIDIWEVGANNGTSAEDWRKVLEERPGATLVLVSPNMLSGQDAQTQRAMALAVARDRGSRVIEVVLDGVLDERVANTLGCPNLATSVQTGGDATIFPLDYLLGGPAGVVLCSCSESLAVPLSRADLLGTRLRGPELAAAIATMQSSSSELEGLSDRLASNLDNLKDRAKRLGIQVSGTKFIETATEQARQIEMGPAPWNRYCLSGYGLILKVRGELQHEFNQRLDRNPMNIRLVLDEIGGEYWLDLRFVLPKDDYRIAEILNPDLNPKQEAEG
ncbi:MAG: hypothetical protein KDB03_16590 [Planctomycetales bacterium]|nr:hypothetical protein [Planctomycetales bacterium]